MNQVTAARNGRHTPPLRIFLSHKMGRDQEAAQTIAAHLSGHAGAQVAVTCSSSFRGGDNWFSKVHDALENSDWLILLYTSEKEDWQWCMYEVGYFNSLKTDAVRDKRIIVLRPQACSIPAPLMTYKPLPATPSEIRSLFKMIYVDDPWRIAPHVFEEAWAKQLETSTAAVVEAIDPAGLDTERHSITIRIDLRQEGVEDLRVGAIPKKAVVSGTGSWEVAFGKECGTGGWNWQGLVTDANGDDVDGRNYWEPVLASMMLAAYEKREVDATLLAFRVSPDGPVYRPVFHKLSRRESGDLRFYFVLSEIPIADELKLDSPLNILHNLLMLAWRYRTRLFERHRERVYENAAGPIRPKEALKLLQSVVADLNVLNAEAVSRGFTKFHSVVKPFDEGARPGLMSMMQTGWPAGVTKVENGLRDARIADIKNDEAKGIAALKLTLEGLDEMAAINARFYTTTADHYHRAVKKWLDVPEGASSEVASVVEAKPAISTEARAGQSAGKRKGKSEASPRPSRRTPPRRR